MDGVSSIGSNPFASGVEAVDRNKDLQDMSGVVGMSDNPFGGMGASLGTDSAVKGKSFDCQM